MSGLSSSSTLSSASSNSSSNTIPTLRQQKKLKAKSSQRKDIVAHPTGHAQEAQPSDFQNEYNVFKSMKRNDQTTIIRRLIQSSDSDDQDRAIRLIKQFQSQYPSSKRVISWMDKLVVPCLFKDGLSNGIIALESNDLNWESKNKVMKKLLDIVFKRHRSKFTPNKTEGARLSINSLERVLSQLNRNRKNSVSILGDRLIWHCKTEDMKPHMLGKGAFSIVYLVEDAFTRQRYAKKVILKNRVRELNGIQNQQMCQHIDAIPKILDIKGHQVLMENVSGKTLFNMIKSKGLSIEQKISIQNQLIKILNELHQKEIYHCDIKPENIMIEWQRNGQKRVPVVRLIDFGLSINKKNGRRRRKCGTPLYLSPITKNGWTTSNAMKGMKYSLGVCMVELWNDQILKRKINGKSVSLPDNIPQDKKQEILTWLGVKSR